MINSNYPFNSRQAATPEMEFNIQVQEALQSQFRGTKIRTVPSTSFTKGSSDVGIRFDLKGAPQIWATLDERDLVVFSLNNPSYSHYVEVPNTLRFSRSVFPEKVARLIAAKVVSFFKENPMVPQTNKLPPRLAAKAPKPPKKLTGKKLDALINASFKTYGNDVQFNIFDLSKVSDAAKKAYEGASPEDAEKEMNEAMKKAVAKYRVASKMASKSGTKMTKLDRFILRVASQDPYVRNALKEELARYERGEDVPLEDLPEELQENVEDPPPSVAELTRKMERMARRKQAKINERSRLGRR